MSKKSDKSPVAAALLHALAATLRKRHPPGQLMARAAPELDALVDALEAAGAEASLGPAGEVLMPFLRGCKGPAAAQAALQALGESVATGKVKCAEDIVKSAELRAALTSCLRSSNYDTAADAACALGRVAAYELVADEYMEHDPDVIELLAEHMLSGAPREGLQAIGCSVARLLVQQTSFAATSLTLYCDVVPAPRMEDAAIALLWTPNPHIAHNAAEVVKNMLGEHRESPGGRRLASRAPLAAGLRELLGRAAAPPDSGADWGMAAGQAVVLVQRAMKTLMQTVTGDGEVLELAAAVEALSSAVVASRVLRAEPSVLLAPAYTIKALESAFLTVSCAAKRALGCQWLQKQQQQRQQQQQQQQQEPKKEPPELTQQQRSGQLLVVKAAYRDLRRLACAFCGTDRMDGASLRGCRGCSRYTGVSYCSQACCEAHWAKRHHRRLCEMVQAHCSLMQAYHGAALVTD